MNSTDRQIAINELKEICQDIGCSGLSPDMCQNNPHRCGIIQKLLKPYNKEIQQTAKSVVDD